MQRIRIKIRNKIKLKYKPEKNSWNFEWKAWDKKKIRRREQRKLEGWCRKHTWVSIGVLAREKWRRKSSQSQFLNPYPQRSNLMKGNLGLAWLKLSKSDSLALDFEHGASELILPSTQTARDRGGKSALFWLPSWRQNLTLTHWQHSP